MHVSNGLILASATDIGGKLRRHLLFAQQKGGNMSVFVLRPGEHFARLVLVARTAESPEGAGPGPGRGTVLVVGCSQIGGLLVATKQKQAVDEKVADALIVVGIEAKHVLVMRHCLVARALVPELLCKTLASAHIGPGFQKTPEVANV